MDKSEDLSKNVWNIHNIQIIEQIKGKQIEDDVTDHKTHTHIQTDNSHWQLRLSHCPLTQHSSSPLWLLPNNMKNTILS